MNSIIDTAAALVQMDGNQALLRKLARLFLDKVPARMTTIHEALARGDATALQQAAHSLKTSAGILAAPAVFAAAKRLDEIGRSGDLTQAAVACAVLDAEMERLTDALAPLA